MDSLDADLIIKQGCNCPKDRATHLSGCKIPEALSVMEEHSKLIQKLRSEKKIN